ncbi:MAG: GerW family sporulation protein [Syntrophomonadaceae bacterium]|jgi:uncharacterized spore protein YtfJ
MNLQSEMETLFKNIRLFAQTENIVGQPVVIANITIIPILSISFGAGNGATGNTYPQGSGTGAGGKISPIALIILTNEKISLFSLTGHNNLQEITDLLPGIMSSTTAS